jgi:hypothetical protein
MSHKHGITLVCGKLITCCFDHFILIEYCRYLQHPTLLRGVEHHKLRHCGKDREDNSVSNGEGITPFPLSQITAR